MISIIDYGVGNLGSIRNMFRANGTPAEITTDVATLENATHLVLPGVGSFGHGIRQLRASGFESLLRDKVAAGAPVLGICLGAQLLMEGSEEAGEPGLGLIPGSVTKFSFASDSNLRVPHVGWADVSLENEDLRSCFKEVPRFYFVHSYFMTCADPRDVAATATYGSRFVAAVSRGSMLGVQFHPEKSHRFGRELLRHFAMRS